MPGKGELRRETLIFSLIWRDLKENSAPATNKLHPHVQKQQQQRKQIHCFLNPGLSPAAELHENVATGGWPVAARRGQVESRERKLHPLLPMKFFEGSLSDSWSGLDPIGLFMGVLLGLSSSEHKDCHDLHRCAAMFLNPYFGFVLEPLVVSIHWFSLLVDQHRVCGYQFSPVAFQVSGGSAVVGCSFTAPADWALIGIMAISG
ncbi:hypothetical protein TEA_015949 [Camellia sinensis var. sinensis]|uniref:Uncharacterized protein n=1 Tax=Camellia sinensis var. sinensis TaxID=542762 RepID=A0A4S4F352_CAMSN|nr:hypothetical protein TEA_015949 [Camellia sinensis var. sinensis]